jgi:RHS repeat-associated protein
MRYAAVELYFLLFSKEGLCNFWSFPVENGQKHGQTPQIERFYYTPYGELYDEVGDNVYRKKYNQKESNYSTGLTFFDARYYAPELGRFVQADDRVPDMYNAQSYNRYAYVAGSPVEFRDWSGHKGIGGFFKDLGRKISNVFKAVVSTIQNVAKQTYKAVMTPIDYAGKKIREATEGSSIGSKILKVVITGLVIAVTVFAAYFVVGAFMLFIVLPIITSIFGISGTGLLVMLGAAIIAGPFVGENVGRYVGGKLSKWTGTDDWLGEEEYATLGRIAGGFGGGTGVTAYGFAHLWANILCPLMDKAWCSFNFTF